MILSPFWGPRRIEGLRGNSALLWPKEKARGEVATSDFVSLIWDPRGCWVYVGIPPSFGQKEWARQPLLFLSPLLPTPENKRCA